MWDLIDAYLPFEERMPEYARKGWVACTKCGHLPRLWLFNNGKSAACQCFQRYGNHVRSESILSKVNRGAPLDDEYCDELRDNWNHWVKTEEILELEEGMW